jgi:hypothetical protein
MMAVSKHWPEAVQADVIPVIAFDFTNNPVVLSFA